MQGYVDSVAFDLRDDSLAKLSLIGVIFVAKNNIVQDKELLALFKLGKRSALYSYLAIIEMQTGLQYKLIRHSTAKQTTITFQGLQQYDEVSNLMRYDLKEFLCVLKGCFTISRLDIAFDSKEPFNLIEIAKNTNRTVVRKWNTYYFKTDKEKKQNRHLNIKHYFKKNVELYRLEFVFLKRYFKCKENVKNRLEKIMRKAVNKPLKFQDEFYLIS